MSESIAVTGFTIVTSIVGLFHRPGNVTASIIFTRSLRMPSGNMP
jgi:hypothetical protein